jgi:antitoxin (DNA-binding transcriptional repressor) of toxin-antitoxin stability system
MTIDLDDLPPRIARALEQLTEGEAVTLVRGGTVVARLTSAARAPDPGPTPIAALSPEEETAEVLERFSELINDEF